MEFFVTLPRMSFALHWIEEYSDITCLVPCSMLAFLYWRKEMCMSRIK
jgi:hypothetical protein